MDIDLSPETLTQLLGQPESDTLDFKRECDLADSIQVVELMKDIGAMAIDGGYLLIGCDQDGSPYRAFTDVELA